MKKLYPILVLSLIILFNFGCDPREETKQPVACFDFIPTSDIAPGDNVTFTDCSTDAVSYEWDFDDGETSVTANPTHKFDESGTYDVKLVVTNKNLKDEIIKEVVVESQVTACFTASPNPAAIGENITFTNCSEDADSYEWDINGDGTIDSEEENPVFFFNVSGTFETKLIAWSGDSSDEVTQQITILDEGVEIDPTDYNGIPGWISDYYNDFSESGDWLEGSGDTWEASIAEGFYTIIDTDASEDNYGRYYFTNEAEMPTGNYDFEAIIRNTTDNGYYGSGLIFGLDPDDGFNYYKFSLGSYNIGDTDGSWTDWTESPYGNSGDWNKLTVRKYGEKYYFFMNEEYIFSDDYNDFGIQFGFIIDKDTHVDIDEVGIFTMDLTTAKSVTIKNITEVKEKTRINTQRSTSSGGLMLTPRTIELKK